MPPHPLVQKHFMIAPNPLAAYEPLRGCRERASTDTDRQGDTREVMFVVDALTYLPRPLRAAVLAMIQANFDSNLDR